MVREYESMQEVYEWVKGWNVVSDMLHTLKDYESNNQLVPVSWGWRSLLLLLDNT